MLCVSVSCSVVSASWRPLKKDRSYQKDIEDNLKRLSLVKTGTGSSLAAQWLGPHASAAGGTGLIAAQGTKI